MNPDGSTVLNQTQNISIKQTVDSKTTKAIAAAAGTSSAIGPHATSANSSINISKQLNNSALLFSTDPLNKDSSSIPQNQQQFLLEQTISYELESKFSQRTKQLKGQQNDIKAQHSLHSSIFDEIIANDRAFGPLLEKIKYGYEKIISKLIQKQQDGFANTSYDEQMESIPEDISLNNKKLQEEIKVVDPLAKKKIESETIPMPGQDLNA